ncbi:MAG: hypothetical protein HY257_04090 [Chloroflexi bacterium]|nr:hypothetical protein [Chloroflexota bacterium]
MLLLLGAPQQSRVSAAPLFDTQGPKYAGTATSATWTNPSNATGVENNVCASTSGDNENIDLTNFSFSIPAGSTITGIRVEPKSAFGVVGFENLTATLLKSGTPAGSSKTYAAIGGGCAQTTFTSLGGAGDTWGASWTASDINATNFGVRINSSASGGGQKFLDAVRITVFYDPTTPTNVPEADTLLLFGGGLGGLATWLGWQKSKLRARQKKN